MAEATTPGRLMAVDGSSMMGERDPVALGRLKAELRGTGG